MPLMWRRIYTWRCKQGTNAQALTNQLILKMAKRSQIMSSKFITDTFKQVKSTSRNSRKHIKEPDDHIFNKEASERLKKEDDEQDKYEFNILRDFDLTTEYGPCLGITRLERWKRAEKFGLRPPTEVKDIITQNNDNEQYTECVWYDYNI